MDNNSHRKSDNLYWIWLSLRLGNHNSSFQRLLESFDGSAYCVYGADREALSEADCLNSRQIELLLDKDLGEASSIWSWCRTNNVGILTYEDSYYPDSLREMKKPPISLYYMGNIPNLNNKLCVSVVGTRKMTEYGMRSGYKLSYELAAAGAVVVSGMALGIDSVAHAGAIAGGGTTIAVLGCGIDVIYPKQHRRLRRAICEHGAVITAYHPGTPAYKNQFPERNSIISALSEGTLVIEAPKSSGALITAEYAAEQSRAVYALPGSIEEPMSEGPNMLIKNGAVAITCAADILQYYFESRSKKVDPARLRRAEMSSDFDTGILKELDISANCHGRGPQGTPASLLKKLNDQLNDNIGQNSEYYSVPKIKKLADSKASTTVTEEAPQSTPDESVLSTLSEEQRRIFDELACDRPTSLDKLSTLGYPTGTLMAGLTILEIKGLIYSLPGGMYIRK